MPKQRKPFDTLKLELEAMHKEGSKTIGFTMIGLCLVAIEKDGLRIYTEDETGSIYRLIKSRVDAVNEAALRSDDGTP